MKKIIQVALTCAVALTVLLAGMALDAMAAKKSKIDGKAAFRAN